MSIRCTTAAGRYYFDKAEADRACDFFEQCLTHYKGEHAGKPFTLEPWQRELVIRPLFGWKRREDDLRRFRKVYLEIPKKNGKSALGAGVALYTLFCDHEEGAEVCSAASDRDQAGIVFAMAKASVESSELLAPMAEVYKRSIYYPATRSTYVVLSADVKSKHGPNIHCLVFDELHTLPNRDLYDTLVKGIIARRQPIVFEMTTAGDDMESICREEHDYAEGVLNGTLEDDALLPIIFAADPKDDWRAEATWRKVNPSLGVTISVGAMAQDCREAIAEPRKQNAFKRLNLNLWTQQHTVWIPMEAFERCDSIAEPPAKWVAVAGGLDLSSKLDLTAFEVVLKYPDARAPRIIEIAEGQGDPEAEPRMKRLSIDFRVHVVSFFWIPEATMHAAVKRDRVPYDVWADQGWLRVTPGNVVDYDQIFEEIVGEIGPRFGLKGGEIGYDPYNATQLAGQLTKAGFTCVIVDQTVRNISEPAKLFEALIVDDPPRLTTDGNPILQWCVGNVAVKEDKKGNIFPFKTAQRKRIDGVTGTITGLSRLIQIPDGYGESIYVQRSLGSAGEHEEIIDAW